MRETKLRIKRPRRTEIQKLLFWPRVLGFVLDIIIVRVFVIPAIGYLVAGLLNLLTFFGVDFTVKDKGLSFAEVFAETTIFLILIQLLVFILYTAILESTKLQATLGNKLLNLKVYHTDGSRLSFSMAFIRAILKFISIITVFGIWMIDLNDKRQALHDKICGTMIKEK